MLSLDINTNGAWRTVTQVPERELTRIEDAAVAITNTSARVNPERRGVTWRLRSGEDVVLSHLRYSQGADGQPTTAWKDKL